MPRCRGGKVTETLCRDCHKAIHSVFSNKELEKTYNTVEALMAHETFRKMIAYIAKQDPTRKVTFKLTKEQQRRGRNG